MSTPEQPATPGLTRKQMRDIRNTGATPVVTVDATAQADPSAPPAAGEHGGPETPVEVEVVQTDPATADDAVDEEVIEAEIIETGAQATQEAPQASEAAEEPAPPIVAPLPRAALPVAVHDLPGADASVDLGVAPLTRRQARQQERIRTASVPVITPEVAAAHAASVAAAEAAETDSPPAERGESTDESRVSENPLAALFGTGAVTVPADEAPPAEHVEAVEAPVEPERREPEAGPRVEETPVAEPAADEGPEGDEPLEADEEAERAVVNPQFGAQLLAGEPVQVDLPPSFDQIISRSVTGAIGTGNALILSQTPAAPPLVAPVTATGEVMITGSFNLPEGLGSTGHATGTADGKDTDAVLVDGELPAHSSPTPIAASAAISTVKNGGDIIKPPTPEKGGKLMLTLAITAGVLALALVGVLILAFVTGVF